MSDKTELFTEAQLDHLNKSFLRKKDKMARRHFHAWTEMDNEEFIRTEFLLTRIQNEYNMSRWTAMTHIFLRGMEKVREEMKDE